MDKNEIKKELYKQKPIAKYQMLPNGALARKGAIEYKALLEDKTEVFFDVIVSDLGDADLFPEMDAKLLIRYLR